MGLDKKDAAYLGVLQMLDDVTLVCVCYACISAAVCFARFRAYEYLCVCLRARARVCVRLDSTHFHFQV